MDGQVFVHYNSHDRMVTPRVSWIEKYVGKEDPKYWDINSRKVRGSETMFRKNLEILRRRYNQSEGSHIIQWMYGCELRRDGSKGGFNQYGYDGSTFLTFDKATLTWVAPDPQAQITQRKWDAIPRLNQKRKTYLEEICINWIRKYLSYGNETLLRTEVTVRGKTEVEDGMETHVCHLDGFYPREIDASWTRDGEVWEEETFHGSVAPNADGTYHYWLSIWIDPKERGRYRCHVEHDSLQEPLALALEEPTNSKSNLMFIIIGCVMAVPVLVISVVLVVMKPRIMEFFKRRQDTTEQQQVSDLSSFYVISNLEQGPEAPSLEVYVCYMCYLPLHAKNQAVEDGPLFITARLFLEVESSRRNFWDKETLKKMRRSGWWKVPLTENRLCFPRRQRGKAWPNGSQKLHKIRREKELWGVQLDLLWSPITTTDRGSNCSDQGNNHSLAAPCSGDSQNKERGMKRDQPSPELGQALRRSPSTPFLHAGTRIDLGLSSLLLSLSQ
ncbi:putative MHC class I antigen protein [Naja naja]|nr:putative MHC class I antigen protein [Naja naja]